MPAPLLSVAIVNWNTRDLLLICLASLAAESQRLPLEVIVVDNGSSDGSAEAVQEHFPNVKLLINRKNNGFAKAMNLALKAAAAQFICLLNPDCEIVPGALWLLYQQIHSNSEIKAVGPQLLNADGSIQRSGRRLPTILTSLLNLILPEKIKKTRWFIKKIFGRVDFNQNYQVEELSGACFITRQELLEKAGLFDEAFFLYFEEVDWFRRIAAIPGKILYYPKAKVVHHWGGSAKQTEEAWIWNYRSELVYWRKKGKFTGITYQLLVALIMILKITYSSIRWLLSRDKIHFSKKLISGGKILYSLFYKQ